MTDLETHIHIFKALGYIKNRNALIRIVWHIATEHGLETSCEDFIKAISTPTTTTKIVEPIKEK
jgi:hypothetical protein